MGKKKINPNRIPVCWSEADTHRATDESTREMVLFAWALVLCALADRRDTTAGSLLDFWASVNERSSKLRTFDDIETRLRRLKEMTGIDFPFRRIEVKNIRTKTDADRLNRRLRENALHAMFALIADTATEHGIMDRDALRWMFEKVRSRAEDIEQGALSPRDLLGVLEDEYSLRLVRRAENVTLEPAGGACAVTEDIEAETGGCREEAHL